jgi:hypothetical protein
MISLAQYTARCTPNFLWAIIKSASNFQVLVHRRQKQNEQKLQQHNITDNGQIYISALQEYKYVCVFSYPEPQRALSVSGLKVLDGICVVSIHSNAEHALD